MVKKKNEMALIIFALIVLLASGFYYLWQADFFGKKFISQEDEQKWRREQELNVAQIIRAGNLTSCDDVNYKSADGVDYAKVCQNNIALNKAQETLDISWCKKLDGKLIGVENCERQILFSKLNKEKNLAVCDIAPNETLKKECQNGYWFTKSISDSDIVLCKNVVETAVAKTEQATANNPEASKQTNVSRCEENYYLEQLIKNPASADCFQFTTDFMKKDCETYKSTAKNPKTLFINCERLLNPRLQFACERIK